MLTDKQIERAGFIAGLKLYGYHKNEDSLEEAARFHDIDLSEYPKKCNSGLMYGWEEYDYLGSGLGKVVRQKLSTRVKEAIENMADTRFKVEDVCTIDTYEYVFIPYGECGYETSETCYLDEIFDCYFNIDGIIYTSGFWGTFAFEVDITLEEAKVLYDKEIAKLTEQAR